MKVKLFLVGALLISSSHVFSMEGEHRAKRLKLESIVPSKKRGHDQANLYYVHEEQPLPNPPKLFFSEDLEIIRNAEGFLNEFNLDTMYPLIYTDMTNRQVVDKLHLVYLHSHETAIREVAQRHPENLKVSMISEHLRLFIAVANRFSKFQ
jgi:hypothetical protein